MTTEYRLLEVDWLKNMWRPDSFFKNAKSVTFQTMTIPNHYMWLYKDKTILYMVKWVEGKLLQKQRSFFELQVDFAVILCDELHDLPA